MKKNEEAKSGHKNHKNNRRSNILIAAGLAAAVALPAIGAPAVAATNEISAPTAAAAAAQTPGKSTSKQANPNGPKAAKAYAKKEMKDKYGWGNSQYEDLVSLWNKESGWDYQASNASSGAYGIPQALPGGKMQSAGKGWKNNADTQIDWGLQYIKTTYGSPSQAWAHSEATGWY